MLCDSHHYSFLASTAPFLNRMELAIQELVERFLLTPKKLLLSHSRLNPKHAWSPQRLFLRTRPRRWKYQSFPPR